MNDQMMKKKLLNFLPLLRWLSSKELFVKRRYYSLLMNDSHYYYYYCYPMMTMRQKSSSLHGLVQG